MARYEVSAYGAQGNGLAFDHGDHMFDVSWSRDFDSLTDALAFIRTRKSGWAYTDNCDWRRRGAAFMHLVENHDGGKWRDVHRFDVTAAGQPNVEVATR